MLNVSTFRFNDFLENTFVLYNNSRECLIVDPGMYTQEEKETISNFVEYLKLTVKCILLTHVHIDHVMGCGYLMDKYGVQTILHRLEHKKLLNMKSYASRSGYQFDDVPHNFILLDNETEINYGKINIKVVKTPGHTNGGITYICEEDKLVFSGDLLYHGSIGQTHLEEGNKELLIKTIKQKIFILGDDYRIFPGHGPITDVKSEKYVLENDWSTTC